MPSDDEAGEYIVVKDRFLSVSDRNTISDSASTNNGPVPVPGRASSTHRRRSGLPGDSLEGLRALPPVREIPFYEGKELPLEKTINSPRVQTRGASLLATRGNVRNPPCTHCATGLGRFSQCIALDDWFHGACATCQLGTRGNHCSLRKQDRIKGEHESNQQEGDSLNTVPRKTVSSQADTRVEHRSHSHDLPLSNSENIPSTSKKRKRETLQKTSVWKPYISPYMPAGTNHFFEPETPSSYSSNTPDQNTATRNTPPQPESSQRPHYQHAPHQHNPYPLGPVYSNPAYPVNYIYQRKPPQTSTNPQTSLPELKPSRSQPAVRETVERQEPNGAPQPDLNSSRNGSRRRDPSDSLSPSAQLLQDLDSRDKQASKAVPAKKLPPKPSKSLDALINTLPKYKQKEIFGIIDGLKTGIRSCMQQADSMQKQLHVLQSALGIDTNQDDGVAGLD